MKNHKIGNFLGFEKCRHIILFNIILLIVVCPNAWSRDITFLHLSDQHYGSKNFDPNVLRATIDAMNAMPGTSYPDSIGGVVGEPMGVILTGDLTDSGLPDQWSEFVADWGLTGSDGRLSYPVYEGAGNHDGPVSSAGGERSYVRRQIIERNKKRPHVVNVSANGLHYSWDWQDVHFVQLNEYAGLEDSSRYPGNPEYKRKAQAYGNPAEMSLQFLEQDLASKVGKSKRPVVLCQHYGFDGFAFRPWGDERAWWTEEHALRLWEVIEGYNVIAILTGHDGSEAVFNWNSIPNYHMDDNVRFRVYHITDNEMNVVQRNSKTNKWETVRTQPSLIDSALPSRFLQGPYLVYPDESTKMTVSWNRESNQSCELKWGNIYFQYEAGEADVEPYDSENHLYKYTITNLKPNTRYAYTLKIDGKFTPGIFYTAPDSNETKVKFLIYSNPQSNLIDREKTAKAVYDKLYEDPAYHTFLLHTGKWDKQFFPRGSNERYIRYIQSRLPIIGFIGVPDDDQELYQKPLTYAMQSDQDCYSFDYGPVHIAIINRNKEYLLKAEKYVWLEKDLNSTNKSWKVLLFNSYKEKPSDQLYKNVQERIRSICETYGVDIVLSDLNHSENPTDFGGAKQISINSGNNTSQSNINVTSVSKASFYSVRVEDKMLTFEAFDDTGECLDSFNMEDNEGTKAEIVSRSAN